MKGSIVIVDTFHNVSTSIIGIAGYLGYNYSNHYTHKGRYKVYSRLGTLNSSIHRKFYVYLHAMWASGVVWFLEKLSNYWHVMKPIKVCLSSIGSKSIFYKQDRMSKVAYNNMLTNEYICK